MTAWRIDTRRTARPGLTRPDWFDNAACTGQTDLFYPGHGEPTDPAKAICARCPVQTECLAYGLDEHFGIWGGLSENKRRPLRRLRSVT